MGRFLPAEFDKGDANTIGGYAAVHGRPAAFEGDDGSAYSVEIVVDEVDEPGPPLAGYLIFVRWRGDDPVAIGHLETDYLIRATSEEEIRQRIGAMLLSEARSHLDRLIAMRPRQSSTSERPWWEVMRDDPGEEV
jgi:hypothetical protein